MQKTKLYTHTLEARRRISEARKARPPWNKDKIKETAGNKSIHLWLRKRLPMPEYCEICFTRKPHDLANLTGILTRDLKNWLYMCVPCHRIYDWELNKFGRKPTREAARARTSINSPIRRIKPG